MARTGILVLIFWMIAVCFILGAVQYETESEPVTDLSNVTDSFSEDIRDILDLLRMFISLIETANQRLGRVLKLQLESPIPPKNLKTESLDVLFKRFEEACRSFRNRFRNFMATQSIDTRSEKLTGDNVHEKLSDFEHSVIKTYIDGLSAGVQTTISSSEFPSDNEEFNLELKASNEFLTDGTNTDNVYIKAESGDIDETNKTSLVKENVESADGALAETKGTNKARLLFELLTKNADKTELSTSSLIDDDEVTIEEDESPTEPLIDKSLDPLFSSKTLMDEDETADDDTTDKLDHKTFNFTLEPDSNHGTSTFSTEENEESNHSEDITDMQLPTHKIDSELEFLHRLNFEESYQHPLLVSMIGAPGKHFPNYSRLPETSFTCEDKKYIPGVYADLETRCQVFHVCWPHKMESFLCPIGTIFNQEIQSCNYWFSSTCSLSTHHYGLNSKFLVTLKPVNPETVYNSIMLYKLKRHNSPTLPLIAKMKFMPIYFEVNDYPGKNFLHDPEQNELEQLFSKSKRDSKFSKEDIDLTRKIYAELFRLPQKSGAKNDVSTSLDSLFHKMKIQGRKEYEISSSKTDRDGLIETTIETTGIKTTENLNQGVAETAQPVSLTKELDTSNENQKPLFKNKYPHSNYAKNPIASKTLRATDKVLYQGILPQTREMLAASYSKLTKRKKL